MIGLCCFYYPELEWFLFPPEKRPELKKKISRKLIVKDPKPSHPHDKFVKNFRKKIPRCR